MQHKLQLLPMNGSGNCSRQSWTLLKLLCSGKLPLMADSAMQTRQGELGIL